jgi:hypothetical protein
MTISAKSQPRLDVFVKITFTDMPCYILHFDAIDPITQLPLPLDEITSSFTRLSPSLSPIAPLPPSFLESTPDESCGSCYLGRDNDCCKSCHDVFRAYCEAGFRPPPLSEIAQCAEVRDRLASYAGEACRVSAAFKSVRMAGEFHVSPGVSWFSEGCP